MAVYTIRDQQLLDAAKSCPVCGTPFKLASSKNGLEKYVTHPTGKNHCTLKGIRLYHMSDIERLKKGYYSELRKMTSIVENT